MPLWKTLPTPKRIANPFPPLDFLIMFSAVTVTFGP